MNSPRRMATLIGPALVALFVAWNEPGAAGPAEAPVAQQAQPIDREAWARKLADLKEADWRTAFRVGQELAELPDERL